MENSRLHLLHEVRDKKRCLEIDSKLEIENKVNEILYLCKADEYIDMVEIMDVGVSSYYVRTRIKYDCIYNSSNYEEMMRKLSSIKFSYFFDTIRFVYNNNRWEILNAVEIGMILREQVWTSNK